MQLDMFESGALSLRSNGVNVSAGVVANLKHTILEFDALIAQDEAESRRWQAAPAERANRAKLDRVPR